MTLAHSPGGAPFQIPLVDDCSYRLITLENGLKALLVHDGTADKAAAACDVRLDSLAVAGTLLPHACPLGRDRLISLILG